MRLVREKVRNANRGKSFPLFVTEIGWPSEQHVPMFSIGEDDQANLLEGAIKITKNEFSDVEMLLIFQITDMGRSATPSAAISYGLIKGYGGGTDPKKPSYAAVKALISSSR